MNQKIENSKTILPDLEKKNLTQEILGIDHNKQQVAIQVITEKAITLFLNDQEIVTLMTIGDYPELLGLGYLKNQCMLKDDDKIENILYDEETETIVVYTQNKTNYEEKIRKKITTSGCAQGVLFADVMDSFDKIKLDECKTKLKTSKLYRLAHKINTTPSLYLKAGAIHGCVLWQEDDSFLYFEDVGRHNAVDKIAGYIYQNKLQVDDAILYTTGRLTSEMILKTVLMKIPILVSRSGFTSSGVELAKKAQLTLIGRLRGKRFILLSGQDRLLFE